MVGRGTRPEVRDLAGTSPDPHLAQGLKGEMSMTAQTLLAKRFTVLSMLLLGVMLLPGCGSSSYTIPPAELQRLTQLPPSQRGAMVRAFTPGVVPKQVAQPNPPVAAVPPSLLPTPPAPTLAPPPPNVPASGEIVDDPFGPDPVDLPDLGPPAPAIVVSVDVGAPAPYPPAARVRPSPAPRTPPTAPARIAAPTATPHSPGFSGRGSAPTPRPAGGHSTSSSASHHSGGGGAEAAVGVLVGAVLLVGLIAAIAEAADPGPSFDGWIRTAPEHPVHLEYALGPERKVRLCDLRPADLVGVRTATLYSFDGKIEQVQTVETRLPPPAAPSQPAPASTPARSLGPVVPPARPPAPPTSPPAAGPSAPLSWLATFNRAA